MPAIFTIVSNVQTTVGGGVDIGIIKDEEGIGNIVHEEVNLSRLRTDILCNCRVLTKTPQPIKVSTAKVCQCG